MKKLLLLFILATFTSCDIGDDDSQNFTSEFMSIQSVDIPSEFTFGENYDITVNYTRPTSCYQFQRFIFQSDGLTTRTVAVVDTRSLDDSCQQVQTNASVTFNFLVTNMETYVFQFYQGTIEGEDQYLIVEVPVVE